MKKNQKKLNKQSNNTLMTSAIFILVLLVLVLLVVIMKNNEPQITESKASETVQVSDSDEPDMMEAETNLYVAEVDSLLE